MVDYSALSSENLEKLRCRNMWRQCIKTNLNDITKDLLVLDKDRSYTADPRDFMKVIDRRTKISEAMKNNQNELIEYILDFQDQETGKINYNAMASDLHAFNYDRETNEGILPKSQNSITSGAYSIQGVQQQKDVFTDDYVVLNSQVVP